MTLIWDIIKHFLRKAFDIREGEIERTLLMQLNFFLVISTLLIVKPVVYSLFISNFGVEQLPKAFILVAVFAAVVSTIYSRKLARDSLNKIVATTLYISIFSLLFFGILLFFDFLVGWVLYLFYIGVAIFGVLAASQLWILANIIFNAREAKRLFGFIGSGAIAGGIFGGYLTSILAPITGSESLLFVGALLLAICVPVNRTIWKKNDLVSQSKYKREKRKIGFSEHPIHLIKNSQHLTYLATIIGVSVIVAKLVDYQFSAIASDKIIDPDQLTSFFGFWFSNFNIISLVIQLFITNRVVGVFSVGTSLFFLPGGILLGAILLFLIPELWAAIFIKAMDGSLKQSINKAAVELLGLPISSEIKNQTKTFIDVFVDSFATGIGGLILIFFVSAFDLPTRYISIITILLLFVWIYFAFRVRKEYIKSFKIKMSSDTKLDKKQAESIQIASVIGGLDRVLRAGDEKQILFVLNKVKEINNHQLFESTKKLLNHSSAEIRAEAIRTLYFYRYQNLSNDLEQYIHDSDQQVKIAAFEYLIEHNPDNIVTLMNRYLQDPDDEVSGAALVSLAIETLDNQSLRNYFELEEKINTRLKFIEDATDPLIAKRTTLHVIKALGYANIPVYYENLNKYIDHKDPDIATAAITAAGTTLNPGFIEKLTSCLGNDEYRNSSQTALRNYGPGITDFFSEMYKKSKLKTEILKLLPTVVEKIDSQKTVDFLFDLMDCDDLSVRLETLRSLNKLKINFPHLNFNKKDILRQIYDEVKLYHETLVVLYSQNKIKPFNTNILIQDRADRQWDARKSLINLLERRLDGNLERIFRLLGLKYPPEDILSIYHGINSTKPDLRINAIEFLDNLLETNLKRILIPIVETAMMDTLSEDAIKNLNLKIPDEEQCFNMLLEGKDIKIKIAVLFLIKELQDRKYLQLVERYTGNANLKVKTFALKARKEILTS